MAPVRHSGRTVRVDGYRPDQGGLVDRLGFDGMVAAAVVDEEGIWGALAVSARPGRPLPADDERQVAEFAALVAVALVEADRRRCLHEQARRDTLTGALNRRGLLEALERLAQDVPESHVAVIDVDGLKALNDSAGHHEGDRALQRIAGALETRFAVDGIVGRLGGDEFVVALPGSQRRLEAAVAAAQAAAALSSLSFNHGTARLGRFGVRAALESADRALYVDKRSSRSVA